MIDHEELGEESQELFERGLDKNALHLDIREVPARIYKHDLISKGDIVFEVTIIEEYYEQTTVIPSEVDDTRDKEVVAVGEDLDDEYLTSLQNGRIEGRHEEIPAELLVNELVEIDGIAYQLDRRASNLSEVTISIEQAGE